MDICEYVNTELNKLGGAEQIATSVLGRPVLALHTGRRTGRQLIITAGIHARECYTSLAVLAQAERASGAKGDGVWFVPLVNPDGAVFFESGLSGSDGSEFASAPFLYKNLGNRLRWKANAEGVDLNCNFPARFGTGRYNVHLPGPSGYIGRYPLCAPETRALAAFTATVMPAATVSYHSMGGELYWEFFQTGARRERDERFAAAVAGHIGVAKVDGHMQSAGGYKDWCVAALGIPAVTIELVSSGAHPLCREAYSADIAKNIDLPRFIHSIL